MNGIKQLLWDPGEDIGKHQFTIILAYPFIRDSEVRVTIEALSEVHDRGYELYVGRSVWLHMGSPLSRPKVLEVWSVTGGLETEEE